MLRFAITFLAVLLALFTAELTPPAQQAIVSPWTEGLARLSASIVTSLDGEAIAEGRTLRSGSNGFAVSIEAGCNGIEAALMLIAAIVAFPAPIGFKFAGAFAGLVAIQGLNVVRVVSLFYLGQWHATAFEWAHLYVWQILIMLDVLVIWILWVRWVRKPAAGPAQA